MFTITVTNMNTNNVNGRMRNPFFSLRTLLTSPPLESLQRLTISAGAEDSCGLVVWCWLLSFLSSSSPSLGTQAAKFLVHLTMAEILGTSGQVYTRLIAMEKDGRCQEARDNISVLECL